MSTPASCIITGQRGTFRLADPNPRPVFSRLSIDELDDSWHSDRLDNPLLTEGQPHPLYPGLILDQATFDEEVPEFEGSLGSYTVNCRWQGDLRGTQPTKLISRGQERSIGPNFDEFPFSYLTWTAEPRAITGTAGDDVIRLAGNPFANGHRVVLVEIAGGAGLTGQSSASLGTIYYVINRTPDSLQLSTTLGGSAVDFTTDISAGYLLDARFALGSVHPDHPAMFLTKLSLQDTNTEWKAANCTYSGKAWDKPYHRLITVNGQQFSSSEPITIGLTGGWPSSPEYTNFILPEVVVTDTYLTTTAPTTSLVPTMSTPANAPTIQSLTLSGGTLTYNYPYGWSLVDASHADTLNSGIAVYLVRYVYRYIWPVMFR
jgi:hypothetical protein